MSNQNDLEHSINDLPEHVRHNHAAWDKWASEYVKPGEAAWANQSPTWGIWGVTKSGLGMLPEDLPARIEIELGCGTAYVSAWMARCEHGSPASTIPKRN